MTRKFKDISVDEAIEIILLKFSLQINQNPNFEDILAWDAALRMNRNITTQALIELRERRIIAEIGDRHALLGLGYEIKNMGGWKKYLELERIKRDKIRKEYKDVKRRAQLFWPAAIIAILSGSITIFDKIGHVFESILQCFQ